MIKEIWIVLLAVSMAWTGGFLYGIYYEQNRAECEPVPCPIGELFTMIPSGETYEYVCDWELVGEAK